MKTEFVEIKGKKYMAVKDVIKILQLFEIPEEEIDIIRKAQIKWD